MKYIIYSYRVKDFRDRLHVYVKHCRTKPVLRRKLPVRLTAHKLTQVMSQLVDHLEVCRILVQ